MFHRSSPSRAFLALALLFACNEDPAPPGNTGGANASESGSTETGGISVSGGSATTLPRPDEESESEAEVTGGFIVLSDATSPAALCNVWTQDCPRGEKCMPWANQGGGVWNATRCTPLDANPAQPGDSCLVEGSGTSGIDNCDVSSMCWNVDGQTNQGTCVAFCEGSEDSPVCADPDTGCSITNFGVLILCLSRCDPLTQDCSDTEACYPEPNGFFCSPDASGPTLGGFGDPCEFLNVCDPGLFCSEPETVPGCTGSSGCCSEFCDLEDPGVECSGQGQSCTPAYDEGEAPPGYEAVGLCVIPQ